MGYTPDQRRTNTLASALGYRLAENSVPIDEFSVGEGVIVITKNGEPVMSGQISEIELPDDDTGAGGWIKIGRDIYYGSDYRFRRL